MRGIVAFACLNAPPACLLFLPATFEVRVGVGLVWFVVAVPFAVLTGMDYLRRPAADGSAAGRALARGLLLPFGVVTALIGAAMLAWVGYNLLWRRQRAFNADGEGVLLVPVAFVAAGGYIIRLGLGRQPNGNSEDHR